jgi:hypothetical protein
MEAPDMTRDYEKENEERRAEHPSPLNLAYALMTFNKEAIEIAGAAQCLSCDATATFETIAFEADFDQTGICPNCGVDTLIPKFSAEYLSKLHRRNKSI